MDIVLGNPHAAAAAAAATAAVGSAVEAGGSRGRAHELCLYEEIVCVSRG